MIRDFEVMNYFNFPITLLKDFLIDSKSCLDNIFDYCVYNEYDKIKDIDKVKQKFSIGRFDMKSTLEKGSNLFFSFEKPAITGICVDTFWEYYKNKKSDFDKVVLLAYCAIKSIVGSKPYYKTGQNMIFSRMAGSNENLELLPKELTPYFTRDKFCRVRLVLSESWGIVFYSYHCRGLYMSFVLDKNKLADIAEGQKLKSRLKAAREAERSAREQALSKIREPT